MLRSAQHDGHHLLINIVLAALILFASPTAIAAPPQRIASLSLASDEILLDLLKTCGSINQIAALSVFADDPASSSVVEAAKQVKSRVHSEPESLFSLKPDLVIAASFNRPELVQMVKTRNIPLVMLDHFSSALDIADHIESIGKAIQCPKDAQRLKDTFLNEIKTSITLNKKLKLISYSQDLVVMGQNTLFDDLVARAGGINTISILGLKNWPKIDTETLLKSNPDYIIILEKDSPELQKSILNHPAWSKLQAVKSRHFIFLESKTALSTSHYFSNAVKDLKQKLSTKTKSTSN